MSFDNGGDHSQSLFQSQEPGSQATPQTFNHPGTLPTPVFMMAAPQPYPIQQDQQQPQQQPYSAAPTPGYNPPAYLYGSAPVPPGGQPQPIFYPQPFPLAPQPGPVQDDDYFKGFYEGITRHQTSSIRTAMSWIGPLAVNLALIVGPIWFLRRRFQSQMSTLGGLTGSKGAASSFADMFSPLKPKKFLVNMKGKPVRFNDVIGIDEAKKELQQYVEFLSNPEKFRRLGARLPKGCLLTGPPGTGKTLLAKAMAGEANRPFLACSGADFIEIFGGSGPKRVRELFAEAKNAAPCIVFLDELDAIGSRNQGGRSMGGGGSNSEESRTVNQLLAELDGLTSSDSVVVVAATNHPDNIDKALLRDGRFDRKVTLPMPDTKARTDLFRYYLKRVVTGDPECTTLELVSKTSGNETAQKVTTIPGVSNSEYAKTLSGHAQGVSPAQISAIVNEAALASAVAGADVVSLNSLHAAIGDVLIGKVLRQRMAGESLRRLAFHECGHTMMAWVQPEQKSVLKVSIISRGRAGGYTMQVQDEATDPKTDTFFFTQLCVLLGGRVAERVALGDVSTGAIDDLQRATKLAMDKFMTYGMSGETGGLAFRPQGNADGRAWLNYSEEFHAQTEKNARELIDKAYENVLKTFHSRSDDLTKLANLLLEKKELGTEDIKTVLGPRPVLTTTNA